jgi:hypothetical protein
VLYSLLDECSLRAYRRSTRFASLLLESGSEVALVLASRKAQGEAKRVERR